MIRYDPDRDDCDRCGGEGNLEYDEAGPDVWGEDCPSETNHLVACPDYRGSGRPKWGESILRNAAVEFEISEQAERYQRKMFLQAHTRTGGEA